MTNKEEIKFLRQEKIRHIKWRLIMLIPYPIRNWYDCVRFWLNPRQKWLTKQIPNRWIDKDSLWELCILEGIKHYVEKDGGLHYYDAAQKDPDYPQHQREFDKEVRDNYELITVRLPAMEKELEAAWKKVPHFDFKSFIGTNTSKRDYNETYGEVDRIEGEIGFLKTQIMIWAVTKRGSIWT